jgi:hypothetical protein
MNRFIISSPTVALADETPVTLYWLGHGFAASLEKTAQRQRRVKS